MLFYRILLFYERVVRRRRAAGVARHSSTLCLLRLPSDVRPVYRPTKTLQV